ncbi:hypothetical protein EIN_292070, partial [Entamoeba invadens IP1]
EYRSNGAAFFGYHYTEEYKCFSKYLSIAQIFDSLEIDNKVRPELNTNCLIYALQQAKIDDKIIDLYHLHCYSRYQRIKLIDEVSKSCNIRIQIKHEETILKSNANTIMKYIGSDNKDAKQINMYLFRDNNMKGNHYFLDVDLPITPFYLKNREEMNKWAIDHNKSIESMFNKQRYNKNKQCYQVKDKNQYTIKLSELVLYIRDHNVKDIKLDETPKKCKSKQVTYYYADFEASTQGIHKAYCVCYSKRDSNIINCKYGDDCVFDFLSDLDSNSVVYFHNLKYDCCFLAKYGINTCIKKDSKTMKMTSNYNGKHLIIKDSYSMISAPLSSFPSMFSLSGIQKEIYPYNYYTQERIQNNVGTISESGEYECKKWNEEQYKLFNENIDKIENCRIDENHYNMKLYCRFYCKQDVRILKEGHIKFRNDSLISLSIDLDKFISISALANYYFKIHVYTKIPNLKQYGGKIREYIQGAVYGGRNMCRDNKKWHITDVLYDYDACSLYPSAIHRLKLATGKPIVIPNEFLNSSILDHLMLEQQLEQTNERYISAFIVDIEITKVNKELHFPIICKKT